MTKRNSKLYKGINKREEWKDNGEGTPRKGVMIMKET